MEEITVKDIMVPLDEYAIVNINATGSEALKALKESQKNLKPGQFLHRAVLIRDDNGNIIGKIGHLAFLKALEPKYNKIGNLDMLSRSGLTPEFIESLAIKWEFFEEDLKEACKRLKKIKVTEIMHPVHEHIDENASMSEAIHRIVMWQTLSILVTSKNNAVGVLRLSDLFREVFRELIGYK